MDARRPTFGIAGRELRQARQELTSANIEFTKMHHMIARAPPAARTDLEAAAARAEKRLREAEARVAALAKEQAS
jgi:hypothetical protein